MIFAQAERVAAWLLDVLKKGWLWERFCELSPSYELVGGTAAEKPSVISKKSRKREWRKGKLREGELTKGEMGKGELRKRELRKERARQGEGRVPRHRRVLLWHENNRWRNLGRAVFAWLMRSNLGSLGAFLLLFGAFSLAGCWLRGTPRPFSPRLLCSAVLILCSVPLLHARQTWGFAIRRGKISGGFLLGFCGLSETLFESEPFTQERRLLLLPLGVLCGCAATLFHPLLILLFLLTPLLLALLFSLPELTALGIFACLPFCNLASRPTLLLLGLLFLCALTWLGKATSGKRQTAFGKTDLLVALLALAWGLCGVVSAGGRESLFAGVLRALLLLLSWFPMRALLHARLWRERCVFALLLSSLAVSVFGIWQYVTGRATLAWVDLSRFSDIGGRVCAVFENPNMLAVFLLLTLPLSLGTAWSGGSLLRRLLAWAVFASGSLCLILTWSRGAWLGWLAVVLSFFFFHSRRSLAVLLLAPIPTVTAVLYLPRSVLRRFLSIGGLAESSARYRVYTWQGALRLLAHRPFGIGAGDAAFHAVFPLYAVSGTELVMHAHHLLLQIAIEAGLPFLLVFLTFLWRMARRTAFFLKGNADDTSRAIALGSSMAILGGLVMGAFDYIWYHYGLYALFWLLAALWFDLTEKEALML